jgi:arylsulfatase
VRPGTGGVAVRFSERAKVADGLALGLTDAWVPDGSIGARFEPRGNFRSNDAQLYRIWQIGWDTARSMEVAAAMLAYQDEQVGRVLSEMDRMGVMNNTLVALLIGDNGASADQGPEGTFNRSMRTNRISESEDWRLAHIDELGGPNSYPNYEAGWAWAMDTPLRWTKQFASMLGGIRNGLVLSYPGHVKSPGTVCAEFGHVIDIVPTVLQAAGIPAPDVVYGVKQKPMDGQSLLPSLESCNPDKPRTQYFEIGGKKGLWYNGWFASQDDGRKPWDGVLPAGSEQQTSWALYDLDKDFSQSTDLSEKQPEMLRKLVALWDEEARRNQVYPVDHIFGAGRKTPRPAPKDRYDFWGKDISIPTTTGPSFIGRSFTIDAELELASGQASGVVMALGSRFAGWTLFLENGKPTFVYAPSLEAEKVTRIASEQALPGGAARLRLTFAQEGLGKPANVVISSGSTTLATGRIPVTFMIAGGAGETLDTGRDTGVPVTGYKTTSGEIEGDIRQVRLTFRR